jgi:hypothetical protein
VLLLLLGKTGYRQDEGLCICATKAHGVVVLLLCG